MTSAPLIGVLAIQGAVREHVQLLEAAGAEAVQIRHASDLDRVSGIVLPGGESTTISKLAVIDGLMDPLREAARSDVPMYGSCAGMILLADRILDGRPDQQTIGGIDMTVRRNAFGRQVDSFEGGISLQGFEGAAFPGSSSGLPGWRRSARASKFSGESSPERPKVGSSRFETETSLPRVSIPSSPGIPGYISTLSRW